MKNQHFKNANRGFTYIKFMKRNKGITLIVLIVTIIILLILAGVTISTLSNSGLFGKTQEATGRSKQEELAERIKLAIMESVTADKGELKASTLKTVLAENFKSENGEQVEGESFPFTIKSNKRTAKITSSGEITIDGVKISKGKISEEELIQKSTADLNTPKFENKYGMVITYKGYPDYESSDVWKLFYADESNAYLIMDPKGEEFELREYLDKKGPGVLGQKLNSLFTEKSSWSSTYSSSNNSSLSYSSWSEGDLYRNIQAVGYLTDTTIWNAKYKTDEANWVIGSPTLEMFIASYNSWAKRYYSGVVHNVFACSVDNNSVGYKIITYDRDNNLIKEGWDGGSVSSWDDFYLFKNGDKVGSIWIASPGLNEDYYGTSAIGDCVIAVDRNSYTLTTFRLSSTSAGFNRPVVSIPLSAIESQLQ